MRLKLRKQKQDVELLEKAGADKDDITAAKSRLRLTNKTYVDFSKEMGLRQQRERLIIPKESVVKEADSGIIKSAETKEVADVRSVGKIDRDIYKCVTDDIVTDEVIITDERIGHIKDRHPNDYEKYYEYLKEIVENPDYIVEVNKPNTALILKEIIESDEKQFKTVLRLSTSTDNPNFKNSIITFMKINEREWKRILNNNYIFHKSGGGYKP